MSQLSRFGLVADVVALGSPSGTRGQFLRAPVLSARTPGEPNDFALRGLFAVAVGSQCLSELPPLLEQVAAPVGRLDLVADRMHERHFTNLARKVRLLSRPICETGAKSVNSGVAGAALLNLQQVHHRISARVPIRG